MIGFDKLKKLYQRSPLWLQTAYSRIPFDIRAGQTYRKVRRKASQSETMSRTEIDELQNVRLRSLLQHAYDTTPYYRRLIKSVQFELNALDLRHELLKLPLLDKQIIRAHESELLSEDTRGERVFADNTGGSSGTPMHFVKNNKMYPTELAYMFDQWSRVGYQPGARKLTLRGRTFANAKRKWLINPIYNELVLSAYHLDADSLATVMPVLQNFKPEFMHGYPSAIVTFLKTLRDNDLPIPQKIRGVLCGSEPLYDYQREFIEKTLSTRAFSWYGQSECVLLAGECEFSSDYHSYPLYGFLELIDGRGDRITAPGVEGEIIGTSLNNYAMPFIRYRTGDRGILAEGECQCGRPYPRLRSVNGRVQHYVYTDEMLPVSATAFIFGQHFRAFERISAMQLVQERKGHVAVRVVPSVGFGKEDERELTTKMEESVDGKIRVEIKLMESLPLTVSGKQEFVIQILDPL